MTLRASLPGEDQSVRLMQRALQHLASEFALLLGGASSIAGLYLQSRTFLQQFNTFGLACRGLKCLEAREGSARHSKRPWLSRCSFPHGCSGLTAGQHRKMVRFQHESRASLLMKRSSLWCATRKDWVRLLGFALQCPRSLHAPATPHLKNPPAPLRYGHGLDLGCSPPHGCVHMIAGQDGNGSLPTRTSSEKASLLQSLEPLGRKQAKVSKALGLLLPALELIAFCQITFFGRVLTNNFAGRLAGA